MLHWRIGAKQALTKIRRSVKPLRIISVDQVILEA